jgi:hypothetical protein
MGPVHHRAGDRRCGGAGAHRVVPDALAGGGESQGPKDGLSDRAASVVHSAPGRLALLGFLAIVAVRLLQLRTIARTAPDTPARPVVEPEFVEAIRRLRGGSAATMTVDQFWRRVAGLGGFLGRRGDGDPGWQTLWRGWQRLQDLCWGMHQTPGPGKKCG